MTVRTECSHEVTGKPGDEYEAARDEQRKHNDSWTWGSPTFDVANRRPEPGA